MIAYFCPDKNMKSGGIRRIYRHVQILSSNGFQASVMHGTSGFRVDDTPPVPIIYADQSGVLSAGDSLVVPEGLPGVIEFMKGLPVRRFVFALNWSYIYNTMRDGVDWRISGLSMSSRSRL